MSVILGLDSATQHTGWAVFKNGKLFKHSMIDLAKIKIPELRIRCMVQAIQEVLSQYAPDVVVAELTAVERNAQTQRMLTMLLGAIMGWCVENEKDFVTYRPSEWRAHIEQGLDLHREEWKKWAIQKAKTLCGAEVQSDDEAEAILIGKAYLINHKEERGGKNGK